MKKKLNFESCPICGGLSGFYTKTSYINVPYLRSWDGESQYNGEMFDNAEEYSGGRMVYCQDCGKVICRVSTIEKMLEAEGLEYE